MSEEQLKAFLEKVKGDTSLQEKLQAAADANAVAAIAKEAGFSISADEINKAQSEQIAQRDELSEEELEKVAGGNRCEGCNTTCCGFTAGYTDVIPKHQQGGYYLVNTYKTRRP